MRTPGNSLPKYFIISSIAAFILSRCVAELLFLTHFDTPVLGVVSDYVLAAVNLQIDEANLYQ
jgi:hypothetical protein